MKNEIMKTVLVTGGTGFIGRYALPVLTARGCDVHLAARAPASSREVPQGVHLHGCDLFDPAAQRELMDAVRPTHLLHLAWYTAHGKFWSSEENLRWVQASLDLIRNFAAAGGRRAVCAGTCAEYDWSFGCCSEHDTPARPRTLYGACKNGLRQMVEQYAATQGFSNAWGRVFFLYGPGEAEGRFVPSLVRELLADRPARCNFGSYVRDFLHVTDVAEAFVQLLESDVQGPVNIASGVPLALGQFAEMIADRLARRNLLEVNHLAATLDNPAELVADTSRLRNEVGWSSRISLDAGVDDLLQSFVPSVGARAA